MSPAAPEGNCDAARLEHFCETVRADIDAGLYWGGAFRATRHGQTVLDSAIGFADADRTQPISPDSVFTIFSVTKSFINALVLRSVELGRIALTTRVVDIIPEFAGAPRDRATEIGRAHV